MNDDSKSVLNIADLPQRTGSIYPPEFAKQVAGRTGIALGNAFGLTQFGANITVLEPGAWSSHRHAHQEEDELIVALEGEMVIVDNQGRHPFRPGMVAGYKCGTGNAHHVTNESQSPARFLVIGTRSAQESVDYPDVDMHAAKRDGKYTVTRKNGSNF